MNELGTVDVHELVVKAKLRANWGASPFIPCLLMVVNKTRPYGSCARFALAATTDKE